MSKIITFGEQWGFRLGDVFQFKNLSLPQYFCSDRSICKVIRIHRDEWTNHHGTPESSNFVTFRHASGHDTTHTPEQILPHLEPANPLTALVLFGENR